MRVWDVPSSKLCRQHLLGEHGEIHVIWKVLTQGKRGWSGHPETMRWRGKLRALYLRHEEDVAEMLHRGLHHSSALDPSLATGSAVQDVLLQSVEEQEEILRSRKCGCPLPDDAKGPCE